MFRHHTYLLLFALCGLLLTGCSQQTIDSAQKDVTHDAQQVGQAAQQAARDAKPQLDKLGLGARVTAAIQANANLPKTIRVDADTNGVRLRGTVKTKQQKELAGHVARETLAPNKTLRNELQVTGG